MQSCGYKKYMLLKQMFRGKLEDSGNSSICLAFTGILPQLQHIFFVSFNAIPYIFFSFIRIRLSQQSAGLGWLCLALRLGCGMMIPEGFVHISVE